MIQKANTGRFVWKSTKFLRQWYILYSPNRNSIGSTVWILPCSPHAHTYTNTHTLLLENFSYTMRSERKNTSWNSVPFEIRMHNAYKFAAPVALKTTPTWWEIDSTSLWKCFVYMAYQTAPSISHNWVKDADIEWRTRVLFSDYFNGYENNNQVRHSWWPFYQRDFSTMFLEPVWYFDNWDNCPRTLKTAAADVHPEGREA